MKKLLSLFAASLLACAPLHAAEKITIGATAVPHAEILEFVKPELTRQGVELTIKVFNDYVQPNLQLEEKSLDANFMQHQPYLDEFNKSRNTHIVTVVGVHIEPFGVYSRKVKTLDEVKEGATIALPNDATNEGRALLLLDKTGLITLKDPTNIMALPRDIADNPKKLRFMEMEAPTLPRVLDEVELALINTNYALDAGLNPMKDALAIEDANSPYVNILAARPDNKDSDAMQKLAKALHSDALKQFILDKYKGAVVPAF